MIYRIKYLAENDTNPLYDVGKTTSFTDVWKKTEKLCDKTRRVMRFAITLKDDNTPTETVHCYFAVFKDDVLTMLWQGSFGCISSIEAEIQNLKETDINTETKLSSMPNNKVICYQNDNDVRFLTSNFAYVGSLETKIENWKEYIYL